MKKLEKAAIIGIMTVIMAVSLFGCKAKEPATEENSDTEQQEEQETDEDTEQQEEQETDEDTEEEAEQKADSVRLAVFEEGFHTAFTLMVGESRMLKVNTNYDGSLEYKSDNEEIATVDQEGNVTATGAGRVNLTITAGDVTRDVNVVVKALETDIESENPEENRNSSVAEQNAAVETGRPVEQNSGSTTMNISISTVITNSENESVTVIPFEQTVEIPDSSQEDYHIEWQYVLE